MLQSGGEIDEDINYRIIARWVKMMTDIYYIDDYILMMYSA
jgi:hypothetical protein